MAPMPLSGEVLLARLAGMVAPALSFDLAPAPER